MNTFRGARAVGVFALAAALACAQTLGVNNYGFASADAQLLPQISPSPVPLSAAVVVALPCGRGSVFPSNHFGFHEYKGCAARSSIFLARVVQEARARRYGDHVAHVGHRCDDGRV